MKNAKHFYIIIMILILIGSVHGNDRQESKSVEDLFVESNLVVRGIVTNIEYFEKGKGRTYSRVHFTISELIKGEHNTENEIVLTYLGGTIDGLTTIVPSFPQFVFGEESLLFLTLFENEKDSRTNYLVTGQTQGKFNIVKKSGTDYVTRDYFEVQAIHEKSESSKLIFKDENICPLSEFLSTVDDLKR